MNSILTMSGRVIFEKSMEDFVYYLAVSGVDCILYSILVLSVCK